MQNDQVIHIKSNVRNQSTVWSWLRRLFHIIQMNSIVSVCLFFISSGMYSQQLQKYIEEAEQNNPNIQSLELGYEVTLEKVNEIEVPNTQIGIGYFVSKPETRTGAQEARLSIKQMLPWFGTITAKENYANALAKTAYMDLVIAKRKIALSVSQSYYSLYALQEKAKVIENTMDLLKVHEELALKFVEIGTASLVDVMKLQLRSKELIQQQKILEQQVLSERATFNTYLNRDSDSHIVLPEKLPIPQEVIGENSDLDSLQLNPELLKYDALYQSVVQSEEVNQKNRGGQIGFGIDYIPVSERTDMQITDNGKDIIMPMLSVSIPLFTKKYDSRTRQNVIKKEKVMAEKKDKENKMKALLTKAITERNSAIIRYNTQNENLQQLEKMNEIVSKNYETGTIDIENILDISFMQLIFGKNQIESVQNFYTQTTIINYLTN